MALTGCHLVGAGDALAAKLATHYVPTEKLPALVEALKAVDLAGNADQAVKKCLDGISEAAPKPTLLTDDNTLPAKLGKMSSESAILSLLKDEAKAGGWAAELVASMQKGSFFSQAVAFSLLELAEADALADVPEPFRAGAALERDFAAACRVMYNPDFVEGLRAVLVDKDNAPKFGETVSIPDVVAAVSPLPKGVRKLGLPVA
mmetsp:Transcript_115551/g.321919  ORF Transcript_115551/g.321919 Transcript_115551/m.321919 type:complete len:204 (+) Transcript_115551:2-613(+)